MDERDVWKRDPNAALCIAGLGKAPRIPALSYHEAARTLSDNPTVGLEDQPRTRCRLLEYS